jgi:hypothetical protein
MFTQLTDSEGLLAKVISIGAGALVSTRLLTGSVTERLLTALAGGAIAYVTSPYLSNKIGLPESITGFLMGLFGMAIASRLWEFIQTAPISDFWKLVLNFLTRLTGGSSAKGVEK